jgi:peptidyl-prolyl cis-trans isomerase D
VRDEVVKLWQEKQRQEKAKARAEQILAAVQSGKSLEAAASQFGLKPVPAEPAVRSAGFNPRASVPPEVNAKLFAMKPSDTAIVPVIAGAYVVRLTQVVAADPAADAAGVEQLRSELRQQMSGDVVQAYVEALRQRYGVTINRDVVDRVAGS